MILLKPDKYKIAVPQLKSVTNVVFRRQMIPNKIKKYLLIIINISFLFTLNCSSAKANEIEKKFISAGLINLSEIDSTIKVDLVPYCVKTVIKNKKTGSTLKTGNIKI